MTEPPSSGTSRIGQRQSAILLTDPSWKKWSDLVDLAVEESKHPAWTACVSARANRPPDAPMLHGAFVRAPGDRAATFVTGLVRQAGILAVEAADPVALMRIGIERDARATEALATRLAVPADTCALVGQLGALPLLLNASRRLNADVARTWQRGYCPVCGAWPSMAEMRGIQRERRLRCGCCGSDWLLPVLRCAFCDESDHQKLGYFTSEGEEHVVRVETCGSCRGYLKSMSTLGALPVATLAAKDLSTVAFDLAAADRGYARPSRPGWRLKVEIGS